MINLDKSELDDIEFVQKIQILVNEIISHIEPNEVFIFKVDNWFDSKWLNFTGKILGALGTWNYDSSQRIPPFNPNRILEQIFFQKNQSGTYSKNESIDEIHRKQSSEQNLKRKIIDVSDSAVFIWYSSNTTLNGHGSLMIYPVENKNCEPFYVGFRKEKNWDIMNALGSNKKALEFYIERSKM